MSSLFTKIHPKTFQHLRNYCIKSTITLNSPSKTSKKNTQAALLLLKSETNPEKILNICRTAALKPESNLDRVALSIAIRKLAKSNYQEGIRVYIEELKARDELRNELFLSSFIVLYGQAGMIENGITTFEQMAELGIRRTVKSFNALLLSCILAKNYDEVKRIFTEFPTKYKIVPDIDSYNTVIKAFGKAGESSSGYEIVAEMGRKSCKPNATTFTNLIAGIYKEEKFEEVEKVLKLMEEHGMKPELFMYNARIDGLCKLGRSSEAKELLDDMLEIGIKPNTKTYSSLIHGFSSEGKFEEAKVLFTSMVNHGCKPNSCCYYNLIYFLCKGGDYETAFQVSKKGMEKDWVPNVTTIKSLVEGLVSISKVEEAKELVELIKEKFPKLADAWRETEENLSK